MSSKAGGYNHGFNCDSTAVRLPFDCNSTALRPFDDIRYDRRHCGVNKLVGQRDCDSMSACTDVLYVTVSLMTSVERPSNRSRIVDVTTA